MATILDVQFGPQLAEVRSHAGLSQRQLGLRAGIGASAIGQYESGHRGCPRRETVEKIGAALMASREEFRVLMTSAGHGDPYHPRRPTLEVFLRGDPALTAAQRGLLVALHGMLVKANRGA